MLIDNVAKSIIANAKNAGRSTMFGFLEFTLSIGSILTSRSYTQDCSDQLSLTPKGCDLSSNLRVSTFV